MCTKSMKLKYNGTGAKTPVRNELCIGLKHKGCYLVDGWTFGWGKQGFLNSNNE